MNVRRSKETDPLERAIEAALAPGRFVSYHAASSFVKDVHVKDVQAVADRVGSLIKGEPERAARLYETFIAACHEKADIDAYIQLSRESGLGAEECRVIADIYRAEEHFEEALDWVERGLKIGRDNPSHSFAAFDLNEMKRALLVKLGRRREALESAWSEFRQHPSTFSYKVLMRHVSPKEKKAWHGKAMEAAEKSDLSSQIELWLELSEVDRLAFRLGRATDDELEGLSHYTSEPAARKRERPEALRLLALHSPRGLGRLRPRAHAQAPPEETRPALSAYPDLFRRGPAHA